MMLAALEDLRGRNVVLDGVPAMQDMYSKYQFKPSTVLIFGVELKAAAKGLCFAPQSTNIQLDRIDLDNIKSVMKFDKTISTIDRSDHLPGWIISNCSVSFGAFQDGACVGYICARYDSRLKRYKIQPLFADSDDIGLALIQALVNCPSMPAHPTLSFRPTVQNKERSLGVIQKCGEVLEISEVTTQRMHLVSEVKLPLHRVFSITNRHYTII